MQKPKIALLWKGSQQAAPPNNKRPGSVYFPVRPFIVYHANCRGIIQVVQWSGSYSRILPLRQASKRP